MIYINKQLYALKNENGVPEGKRQELFPHLCDERGGIVRKIWFDLDVERGELNVEAYGITQEQIIDALKQYLALAKESCVQLIENTQKRLAALEAAESKNRTTA